MDAPTMQIFFNNKIKIVLLILIWLALMRTQYGYGRVAVAATQDLQHVDGVKSGNDYADTGLSAAVVVAAAAIYEAHNERNDNSVKALLRNPDGLRADNGEQIERQVTKDPMSLINAASSGAGGGVHTRMPNPFQGIKRMRSTISSTKTKVRIEKSPASNLNKRSSGFDELDNSPLHLTGLLLQQLIYEFAGTYKRIPRVTYFTCRNRRRENDNNDDNYQNNTQRRQQQTMSFNMNTMEILKRMQAPNSASSISTMHEEQKPKEQQQRQRSPSEDKNELQNTDEEDSERRSDFTPTDGNDGSGYVAGADVRHSPYALPKGILIKVVQIDQLINKQPGSKSSAQNTGERGHTGFAAPAASGRRAGSRSSASPRDNDGRSSLKNEHANWLGRILHRADALRQIVVLDLSCGLASRKLLQLASDKALFDSAYHWLLIEDYAFNRQTGINDSADNNDDDNDVNAVAGAGAVADATDDDENSSSKNNSDNNNSKQEVVSNYGYNNMRCSGNSNRNKGKQKQAKNQDIVDASASNVVTVAGIATDADTDINDASAKDRAAAKATPGDGAGTGGDANLSQDNGKAVIGNWQQQHKRLSNKSMTAENMASSAAGPFETSDCNGTDTDTNTAADAGTDADNDDDMEIIEKFLEKINININTELILAKRKRSLQDGVGAEDLPTRVTSASASNAKPTGNSSGSHNSNKTLQKKDNYMLYDVWNPGAQYGGQLNITEIGNFTLDDGIQIAQWHQISTAITRRMDMKMARIRCMIVITNKNRSDTLEHYLTTQYDTHLDSMNRFNFALISYVRDLYNFSFVLSKTPTWGYLKNGKFDGMIGALVNKQVDIGGSPIFFRIERAKVIDYTSRTWVARPCFIFRHPRNAKKDRIVFLQPFSNGVWISLGICGLLTVLSLWVMQTLESKLQRKYPWLTTAVKLSKEVAGQSEHTQHIHHDQRSRLAVDKQKEPAAAPASSTRAAPPRPTAARTSREISTRRATEIGGCCKRFLMLPINLLCGQKGQKDRHTSAGAAQQRGSFFLESLLHYIGSICQQGLAFSTIFFAGRCIVITSLLFSFAIYQFYSASIVGTLLMEKPKTIRTLADLVHSSLEIGIEDIIYNRDYFLRTNDPVALELYAKKVSHIPPAATPEQALTERPEIQFVEPTPDPRNKSYRDIVHNHETGAHAKTDGGSNWYTPEYGMAKVRTKKFAFHVDVATAYKIISDTFSEKEICDLTEIQLFAPQKMVSIVQKGSPLRKILTYGMRRVNEAGLMDYQHKIWHSPKPRCIKQIHIDDLRVDMHIFASALLVLIFGAATSLLTLGLEIMHHKLWHRSAAA